MDYRRELEKIEKDVGEKKIEKAKLEERQRRLKEEQETALKELLDLGIKPEELDDWLAKNEKELKEGITECQAILSGKI